MPKFIVIGVRQAAMNGLHIYGRLDELSEEGSHKLFDTSFWGVVNGSHASLPHLKRQGGVIHLDSKVGGFFQPYP